MLEANVSSITSTTAALFFDLSIAAAILLIVIHGGKYQDYRRKRVQYYKHVQGLLLVRKILTAPDAIVPAVSCLVIHDPDLHMEV